MTLDPLRRPLGLVLLLALVLTGCRSKSAAPGEKLPLPPASESGLVNGEFLEADYGFALPVPAHWGLLRLSTEQEEDELARLSDPSHALIARVTAHEMDPSQDLSAKDWDAQCRQQQSDQQLTLVRKGDSAKVSTPSGPDWAVQDYHVADSAKLGWLDQEWILRRGDLLLWVHVSLDQATADSPKGKALLGALRGSLSKIHWYEPIGERGISLEVYELENFTASLRGDLQKGAPSRLDPYFDDLYPGRPDWDDWYKKFTDGVPQKADLKVERSGLVINGVQATVLFVFTRKEKDGGQVQRVEKGFQLSKKDGSWKIVAPIKKD